MSGTRRVLVVGAGVTGLLTAVRCAAAGHRVTVLDRGPIPNPSSGSYDQHRALRAQRLDDPVTAAEAAASHERWLAVEALLGGDFYRRVGVVTATTPEAASRASAVAADVGLRLATADQHAFVPVRFPPGTVRLVEPDAGVLLADRVLRAATRWLSRHPLVTLRPWQPVSDVDCDAPAVTTVMGRRIGADVLLVAAGAWTRELLDLPTVLYRQTMVYLQPPEDLARWWENAPCIGRAGPDGRSWLIPPGAGTLLKVSTSAACREADEIEDSDDEERWAGLVLRAGVLTRPARYTVVETRRCHYAVDARTGTSALTRLGPAAWARAASGGDGFRTAPLVADHIAEALTAVPA